MARKAPTATRKKAPDRPYRTEITSVRWTPAELEEVADLARNAGLPLGVYVRRRALGRSLNA